MERASRLVIIASVVLPPLVFLAVKWCFFPPDAIIAGITWVVSAIGVWATFLANLSQFTGFSLRDLWSKADLQTRWMKAMATVVVILASILLLTIALIIIRWQNLVKQQDQPVYPSGVVILVAEFSEGATYDVPTDRTVTHKVITELQKLEAGDSKLAIVELGQVILHQDTARRLGNQRGAAVVIWGTYTRSPTHVLLEPHFEVVSPLVGVENLKEPEERVVDIEELDSFILHFELSQEIMYLSAFVAGMTHYWEDDFDAAIAEFDVVLEAVSNEEQYVELESVHYYKGQVYRQQGKYAEAEEEFKESVTINPMFAAAYNALGLTYHDQGRIDQAVEQYLKAIEVDPQFASAYNNLAVAYGVQDKPVEVRIELYLEALEIEPDSFIFHQNLGLLYHGQDRYDEALAEYQEAVQAYPSDADSHYLLASLYADWARWDEAQEACQKALELNPAHAAAHCLLGTLYDDFGNSEQAVAEYQKALEIDPDEATAHRNLGLQYMYKGELELAQAEYEKAVSLDPENAAGQCTMGALYTKIGRIKQGEKLIAECERLVAMNPEDYLGHNALGMVYSAQEKYPQALLEFQQAVRLAPNSYTLHSNLSSAYKEVGRIQEAIEEAEEALRLTPDPFSAHLRLLALHWAARDYREVASELALTWLAATILFKIFSMLCLVILLSEAYVLKDRRRREKAINTIGRLAVRCFLVILLTVRRGLMKTDAGLQASRTKRGQPFISKTLSGLNRLIAVFYYVLGNASMADGLEGEALENWQRALDTDPGYGPAAHGLVNFYTSKRNLPVACRVARQAIRAKPGDAIMHMQLGDIYMALNMTEEAIREWEDAVKIDVDAVISFRFEQLQSDPLLVPAHFTLGLAFRAKEEIDKAVTGFEATISSSYNHILKRRAEIEIQALREAKSKLD